MPTRADMEAARPYCDRLTGPLSEPRRCGKPMRWTNYALGLEPVQESGYWVCASHGNVLSGVEAAERAGFRPVELAV